MVKAQTKDEKNVLAAVENMRLALISGDRAALENVAAADLSYGHSSGKIQDKAAFVEAIANGSSDFVSIDYKNQTIKVTGKTALVRHELHAKTNDGGKPGEVHLGILLVWQKQSGDWKLLGRQAFKLP
ncbi:MAG: nuclear transport factor 2 family protein [Pedobacter sp.]|nr:MAG: nuclear transport factor 2 family protein [Pedobacter sp.]